MAEVIENNDQTSEDDESESEWECGLNLEDWPEDSEQKWILLCDWQLWKQAATFKPFFTPRTNYYLVSSCGTGIGNGEKFWLDWKMGWRWDSQRRAEAETESSSLTRAQLPRAVLIASGEARPDTLQLSDQGRTEASGNDALSGASLFVLFI